MCNKLLMMLLPVLIILSLASFGCKGKVEQSAEIPFGEAPEELMPPVEKEAMLPEPLQSSTAVTTAPGQPATPPPAMEPLPLPAKDLNGNKQIQAALKNAGFYLGEIDGKIGPQTKKAIEEFQGSKSLKVDGKVGPQTWAQLQQYVTLQQPQ